MLERRRNFLIPTAPAEIRLDDDILFSDFMLKWLEVTKSTIQITTYASYQGMVERVIVPYLRLLAEMLRSVDRRPVLIRTILAAKKAPA